MGVDVTSDRTSRSITIICLHHVEDNIFVGESQPVRQLSIIGGYMARHLEEATHLISAIFWRVTILYSILRMVNSCLSSVIFKGWFFWFSFGCGGMSRALPWLQQQRICLHAGFGSTIARESQPKKQLDAATPGESHEHPSGMACLSCLCQMICQVPGCGISGFLPWTFSKKQDTSMYIYIFIVYIYYIYTYIPYIPYIPWKVKLVYLINKLEFCRKKTLGQCLEFSLRSTVTAVTSKLWPPKIFFHRSFFYYAYDVGKYR